MGLYLSLFVYACSCLFLSVAVCFLHLPFFFYLLRIEHIISIFPSVHHLNHDQYIVNLQQIFYVLLTSLYKNTRVTCSSTLSGHVSSSLNLCLRLKKEGPEIFTIMSGPNRWSKSTRSTAQGSIPTIREEEGQYQSEDSEYDYEPPGGFAARKSREVRRQNHRDTSQGRSHGILFCLQTAVCMVQ